jgi:RNA polymerase primary sigma factor
MEVQEIIRRAIEIGKRTGFITFDQVNELCPSDRVQPEDIEALFAALVEDGIQVTDDGPQRSNLSCSFCGKAQQDVLQLIAGAQGFICSECVQSCVQVISGKHPEWLLDHRKFVDGLGERPRQAPP